MPGSPRSDTSGLTVNFDSQALQDAMQLCIKRRWRLPIWLHANASAELPALIAIWQQLYLKKHPFQPLQGFCLGEAPANGAITWTSLQGQARQLVLGRECDVLLVNGHTGIDWDLVAASMGTVQQGGLWIFVSPADFPATTNPLAKKVLSWPTDAKSHQGYFQRFIANTLLKQPLWQLARHGDVLSAQPNDAWVKQQLVTVDDAIEFIPVTPWPNEHPPHVTPDQLTALRAIERVLTGHRKRPLVLTAHRGRGKSTLLGIAAAYLSLQAGKRILITAPDPASATVALRTAHERATPSALQFVPIDRLLAEKPRCDLLMVDEAAAIPLPQLQQLNSHYSRVVYATTEHGYEGTGRGFQLKFQHYLQQQNPGWRLLHLQQAIRFAQDDPLERVCFNCFLLGPTAAPLPSQKASELTHQWLDRERLLEQPQLLQQVFALLSLAHYQTRVRDLWALLEDPALLVAIQRLEQNIVGVVLVCREGEFSAELAEAIANGERRVQGHLLAQSLAYHLLQPTLAQLPWWRVQRIVIEPSAQRQGLGRQFLQWLSLEAMQANRSLGTSFGADVDLVRFWLAQGYIPVRLSTQLDQATNEYPLLMLQPSSAVSACVLNQLTLEMGQQLGVQRPQFGKLAPALLRQWIQPLVQSLGLGQKRLLLAYAQGQRPLHDVETLLPIWLDLVFKELDSTDADALIAWLWLNNPSSIEHQQKLIDLSRKCIQMTCIKI